jgi:hypothetical protein
MHHRRHDGYAPQASYAPQATRRFRVTSGSSHRKTGENTETSRPRDRWQGGADLGTCGCSSTKEDTGNWAQTRHRKRIDEANYRDGGTPSPSLIAKRRRRNHKVDQPMDAGGPLARRRTSRSWRGASVRRKTHVSTRRTGYADEADCTVVTSD